MRNKDRLSLHTCIHVSKILEKHYWKTRKCWFPAFLGFPAVFSQFVFIKVVKALNRLVKDLKNENIMAKGENASDQHFLSFPQFYLVFFL